MTLAMISWDRVCSAVSCDTTYSTNIIQATLSRILQAPANLTRLTNFMGDYHQPGVGVVRHSNSVYAKTTGSL